MRSKEKKREDEGIRGRDRSKVIGKWGMNEGRGSGWSLRVIRVCGRERERNR